MQTPHTSSPVVPPAPCADCVQEYPAIGDGFTLLIARTPQSSVDFEVRMPVAWATEDIAQRVLVFVREMRALHGHSPTPSPSPLHIHR